MAVVTHYRGVRVPRGRRQLHAGVPLPHEGCAVLLTGKHLLLYRWSVGVVGRQLPLTGRHVSSTWEQLCLQVDSFVSR